jgi:hypothetical protein
MGLLPARALPAHIMPGIRTPGLLGPSVGGEETSALSWDFWGPPQCWSCQHSAKPPASVAEALGMSEVCPELQVGMQSPKTLGSKAPIFLSGQRVHALRCHPILASIRTSSLSSSASVALSNLGWPERVVALGCHQWGPEC